MEKRSSMNILSRISIFIVILSGSLLLFLCENPSGPVPPQIELSTMNDTTVRVGDDFNLEVDVINGDYYGMHFIWYVDNAADTSKEYKKTFNWQFNDTGAHIIVVTALDRKMLLAEPETLMVLVTGYVPTIDAHQSDTSVLWGDTLRINPVTSDSDGIVMAIRWKTDLDSLWYSAQPAGRAFVWDRLQLGTHLILMRAVDDNNLMSAIDTVVVQVKQPVSNLKILENDTTLLLLEPLVIHTAFDGAYPSGCFYQWAIDSSIVPDVNTDTIVVMFGNGQIGTHNLSVHAFNIDSSLISSDIIEITADYVRIKPSLSIGDTVIYAKQILTAIPVLECQPQDIDSLWFTVDSMAVQEMSVSDTFRVEFEVADSGVHTVQLHVKDPDDIEISKEVEVTILPGYPLVKFPGDTTLRGGDTLKVAASVGDVNGTVITTQWFNGGIQIDTNLFVVTYKGENAVTLLAAVQDDDSLWSYDTMVVHFNAPPELDLQKPFSDTLYCTETNPVASADMVYSLFDKENDTLGVKVTVTKKGIDSLCEFTGDRGSASVSVSGPGLYYWTLKVTDSFGSSVSVQDSFAVVMNHTICFVGHSIVSGMTGDGQNGGFRSTVFKGLREDLIPFHNIKAVGPLVTPDMAAYPVDDSCYAISGAKAYEMLFFLKSVYRTLNADMWVIMVGANAQYSTVELRNTIALMDTILYRNIQSKLYMISAPPFPDVSEFNNGNYYRTYFNRGIYDSVAVRNQNGAHISVVDADTLLTDTNMVFDSTWFSDHVHPNMEGYARLGEKIVSVMKSAENPALNEELYIKEE